MQDKKLKVNSFHISSIYISDGGEDSITSEYFKTAGTENKSTDEIKDICQNDTFQDFSLLPKNTRLQD